MSEIEVEVPPASVESQSMAKLAKMEKKAKAPKPAKAAKPNGDKKVKAITYTYWDTYLYIIELQL